MFSFVACKFRCQKWTYVRSVLCIDYGFCYSFAVRSGQVLRYIVTLRGTGANVTFFDCSGIRVCAVMESLIDWKSQVISTTGAWRTKMVRNIVDTLAPAMAGVGLLLSTKPANADGIWNTATARGGGPFLEEDAECRAKLVASLMLGQH